MASENAERFMMRFKSWSKQVIWILWWNSSLKMQRCADVMKPCSRPCWCCRRGVELAEPRQGGLGASGQ
jgi:hypothetical protein